MDVKNNKKPPTDAYKEQRLEKGVLPHKLHWLKLDEGDKPGLEHDFVDPSHHDEIRAMEKLATILSLQAKYDQTNIRPVIYHFYTAATNRMVKDLIKRIKSMPATPSGTPQARLPGPDPAQ